MKDSTRKTLTNIINFVILVLNGLIAMLNTPQAVEVASKLQSVFIG